MSLTDLKQERYEIECSITSIQNNVRRLLEKQEELQARKLQLDREINIQEGQAEQDALKHLDFASEDFTWSKDVRKALKEIFCLKRFLPKQLDVINATMSKKDVIAIMPTGGGKSLCYQIPALISKGLTIVITPLVSLMENQVFNLKKLNIKAEKLSASSGKDMVKLIHSEMINSKTNLKLLYITPEKISKSKRFMAQLEKCYKAGNLNRIAIDEVHCASQWGNDFRPDYKILGLLRRQFPDAPIIGLTATSTTKVTEDTKKILNIPFAIVFKTALNRPNLFYEIRPKPSSNAEVVSDIVKTIKSYFLDCSGIIYCFSRKDCETLAKDLCNKGIKSTMYHANMTDDYRTRVHELWLDKKVQVICATVAFGMGIDKPDVRFVIHHSIPKSIENYYQESGRAGRDGKPALCLMYYGFGDVFRQSTLVLTEDMGLKNLNLMTAYCNENKRCRRQAITEHFGEKWKPSNCDKSCDQCANIYKIEEKDITNISASILDILKTSAESEERFTGLKLVEAAAGKGKFKTKNSYLKSTNSDVVKKVILYLLQNEFIREDFHFTPYSTISYLELGPKANFIGPKLTMLLQSTEINSNAYEKHYEKQINKHIDNDVIEIDNNNGTISQKRKNDQKDSGSKFKKIL